MIKNNIVRSFAFAALILLLTSQIIAQDSNSISGKWRGYWNSPSGYIYFAELNINVNTDGTVTGYINWTLQKSPNKAEQTKIGLKGKENIRGKYDSQNRIITFHGDSLDDPNVILGMDNYKLVIADNYSVMGGITENHGDWKGQISLVKD